MLGKFLISYFPNVQAYNQYLQVISVFIPLCIMTAHTKRVKGLTDLKCYCGLMFSVDSN